MSKQADRLCWASVTNTQQLCLMRISTTHRIQPRRLVLGWSTSPSIDLYCSILLVFDGPIWMVLFEQFLFSKQVTPFMDPTKKIKQLSVKNIFQMMLIWQCLFTQVCVCVCYLHFVLSENGCQSPVMTAMSQHITRPDITHVSCVRQEKKTSKLDR